MHEFEVAIQYQNDPTIFHKLSTPSIPRLLFTEHLQKSLERTNKRLFCFDYDGTLVRLHKYPSLAIPTYRLVNLLIGLTSDPKNYVYIITGRDQKVRKKHYKKSYNVK